MDVYLGRRPVGQIRDAAQEAIEDGDNEALREEILDAFAKDDTRMIERQLDGEDLYDFINTMLEDWNGDDIDELFELLESQFAEIGVDLRTEYQGDDEDDGFDDIDGDDVDGDDVDGDDVDGDDVDGDDVDGDDVDGDDADGDDVDGDDVDVYDEER